MTLQIRPKNLEVGRLSSTAVAFGPWDRLEPVEHQGHVRFLECRLLKYIVAVAETSNFTRAAERLFLAQRNVDFIRREINLDRTKNGSPRMIPMNDAVMKAMQEFAKKATSTSKDALFSRSRVRGNGFSPR